MRRKLILGLVIVLAAAVFGACGAGKSEMAPGAAPAYDSASGGNRAQESKAAAPQSPAATPAPGAPAGEPTPVPLDRKIIKNANFDVKIKDGDAAVNKITAAVAAAGGYVQDVKQSGTRLQGRTINVTVRVPAGQYEPLTTLIRDLGEVTKQHQWTQDVTEQYVDLEERIKAKEAHLNSLHKLLAQGGSTKELLEVAAEIDRVTADLESMKGRMRVISNQVDFSTMVVNLYEPGAPAPIEPPKTVWERMQRGFTGSWNGVVNFGGDLVVAIVTLFPVLVVLAVIGGIVWAIVRFVRKRLPKRAPPPAYYPPPYPPAYPPTAPPPSAPPIAPQDQTKDQK
ncbi:MAG TPA: DUF4349 domain-containing protein [Symbiobacteriaceae bacterium]|nr:DUF4349 domain-containing protein [Symbiobacteriaceae bacterium]